MLRDCGSDRRGPDLPLPFPLPLPLTRTLTHLPITFFRDARLRACVLSGCSSSKTPGRLGEGEGEG